MGLFGKKSEDNELKLPGPRAVPTPVEKYLINMKIDGAWIRFLKSVTRNSTNGSNDVDIRIYDPSDVVAHRIQMVNYTTLDNHPEVILYEGSFNEATNEVKLTEKRKFNPETPIYTKEELAKKIDTLTEPGSTIFFYQSRGISSGGPLGKGAAVVELNPDYPQKSNKKYNVYTTNVIDMKPVGKGTLMSSFKDSKSAANLVKDYHSERWSA